MTIHRFLISLFNDFETVTIGEVEDLLEKSEIVKAVQGDASGSQSPGVRFQGYNHV